MKITDKIKRCSLFFLTMSSASAVLGAELVLTNGDIIHGELEAESETTITWMSELFGVITVQRDNVQQIVIDQVAEAAPQPAPEAEAAGLSEPSSLSGSSQLSYNRKRGNTDSEEAYAEIDAQWQLGLYRHDLAIEAESEKTDGLTIEERYKADYQLNYMFDDRWFTYGKAGYEKDLFGANEEQQHVGLGIGYRKDFSNQLKIDAQTGISYLVVRKQDGKTEKGPAGRWALRLDWPFGSGFSLFHDHEILWSLRDINDSLLDSSTGMKIPLLGGVYSELRYDYDFINRVEGGEKRADHEFRVLLGYDW